MKIAKINESNDENIDKSAVVFTTIMANYIIVRKDVDFQYY